MSPRPILKRELSLSATTAAPLPFSACSSATMFSPAHVRFPPTPGLITSTHLTHSTTAYDRAPIAVQQNACALPERGCPGRTYPATEGQPPQHHQHHQQHRKYVGTPMARRSHSSNCAQDGYFPPVDSLLSTSSSSAPCPELVPDHGSSESDDSDGLVLSPPDGILLPPLPPSAKSHNGKAMVARFARDHQIPLARASSHEDMRKALAFLPHPPSPDSHRRKRSITPPKTGGAGHSSSSDGRRTKSSVAFASPPPSSSSSFDACLGGF